MSSVRWLLLVVTGFVAALAISGWLYVRSRSADFDRHAQAVEGIAKVRHFSGQLSEQVLASRFGLLNQYDPITTAEKGLVDADSELRPLLDAAVEVDGELQQSLERLSAAINAQHAAVERFKAENSVLKNSLFLPADRRRTARQRGVPSDRPHTCTHRRRAAGFEGRAGLQPDWGSVHACGV